MKNEHTNGPCYLETGMVGTWYNNMRVRKSCHPAYSSHSAKKNVIDLVYTRRSCKSKAHLYQKTYLVD